MEKQILLIALVVTSLVSVSVAYGDSHNIPKEPETEAPQVKDSDVAEPEIQESTNTSPAPARFQESPMQSANEQLRQNNLELELENRHLKNQILLLNSQNEQLKDQIILMTKQFIDTIRQLNEWFVNQIATTK